MACRGARARLPRTIAGVHDTPRRTATYMTLQAAAGRGTPAVTCRGAPRRLPIVYKGRLFRQSKTNRKHMFATRPSVTTSRLPLVHLRRPFFVHIYISRTPKAPSHHPLHGNSSESIISGHDNIYLVSIYGAYDMSRNLFGGSFTLRYTQRITHRLACFTCISPSNLFFFLPHPSVPNASASPYDLKGVHKQGGVLPPAPKSVEGTTVGEGTPGTCVAHYLR